jgi:hypothetical protein
MIFLLLFLPISALQALDADSSAEDEAVKAAQLWLDSVDAGNYDASWQDGSQYFKNAITKEKWSSTMNAIRTPLGKLIKRKLKTKGYTKTLPGAPDGEYVVILYETSFENKESAVETITPMLDEDGKWRVSGYYIR